MTDEEYLERLKGLRVSSGKRPESLNQSRNVNAPLQLARGWTAGLLGLPGDIEGLVRMLPGIENETPVLPTSDFYREYLPGYDPAPAARAFSGLGALAGGLGATKVAGAGVKGAKAAGRALGPKAAEMAESYLQSAGLAPSVVKPKGGNWLSGSVEGATQPLKRGVVDEAAVRRLMGDAFADERLADPIDNAINNWIDTKLNKYIRNEMGTPEDPVRRLAERGVTHMQNPPQPETRGWVEVYRQDAGYPREGLGQSPLAKGWENVADEAIAAQSAGRLRGALSEFEGAKTTSDIHAGVDRTLVKERAKQLEETFKDTPSKDLADEFNLDYKVTDANRAQAIEDWARMEVEGYYRGNAEDMLGPHYRHKVGLEAYDAGTRGENLDWLSKIPEDQPIYALQASEGQTPEFQHLIDELRNATRADSDLPANLRWKPEDLKKVTMEQAVERVAKINDWRAAQMEAAKKAAREGIPLHKEYEGGFQWMAAPDTAIDPKSLQYIKDVGCEGGWCTQGEDLARQYGGRGNQLYVLHEPSGKPVVQISVRPARGQDKYYTDWVKSQPESVQDEITAAAIKYNAENPKLGYGESLNKILQDRIGPMPPEIVEIKGKQNRAPKEEHLPMVQDFVRSGNWSKVGDLKNTGLIKLGDQYLPKEEVGPLVERASRFIEETPALREHREAQRAYENYTGPVPSAEYTALQRAAGKQVHPTIPYTYRELRAILDDPDAFADRNTDALGPNLERIERLRQLVGEKGYAEGGFVQDTEAQPPMLDQMRLEMMDRGYAGGGLIKALKGATKAHPTVFPPVAPLTQAEMRPIAQRIAEQMTEEFVRPNPKLSKNPANKTRKTFEREKDLPVETVQRIEPKPAPVMDYEQMRGGYLVGVPGDPTLGGVAKPGALESVHQGAVELRRLGDVEFGQNPTGAVQLFGGPRYGSFDDRFWASNLGPAQAIQNRATELGELGPVYGQYIKMAPPSTNFALHNLDALLAYQEPEKLSKTKLEQLNREIRKGSPKYGKFPGFAGFEDPIDVLLQAQMNSDLRKHIAETLMKPDTTNALGLRPGSDVLFGITTPSLRNLETGVSGYSIGKLEPGVELMPSLHPTYDYDIPGMFLGQSKYPVPYEIAFPRSTAYTRANLKPGAQEFNTLKMIGAREEIDPQYIDQIKMYEELMKEYTGKKEGGLVKPEGAEDFAQQIMAKIANNPVSARDGNRISD